MQQTQLVKRIGMVWLAGEDLTIQVLGGRKPAGFEMLQGER
jgi:hypothetical protein